MTGEPSSLSDPSVPVILVPEVRDYLRINAEIVALLDQGHPVVRLVGADRQRLLASRLVGPWNATVEVEGKTGPEFAADLDAPGLKIIARGATLDGGGRGLRNGTIVILGDVGDGLGYAQTGGVLVVAGSAGHRAGLGQSGGVLAVLGSVGRLAGDRQSGGLMFVGSGGSGPNPGRGHRGGRRIAWRDPLDPFAQGVWDDLVEAVSPWVDSRELSRH